MTYPWGDDRRFNSYSAYLTKTLGGRVQKISVDAGFNCPNRDGTIGTGGCSFCSNAAFNPSYCRPEKSIRQQIEEGIAFHKRRYRRVRQFWAYFQPYSNTYKPLDELKDLYAQALELPEVTGIVIGTRPDLVDEALLQYLSELQKTCHVTLEYGVESVYDETLQRVNRGHDFATAEKAIRLTAQYGIACGAHFIFGLPGETRKMMLDAVEVISQLPLTTLKLHQLQIFKNTRMAEEFVEHPEYFHLFNLEDYIDFVIDFAERLNPHIVIERFAGEVPPRFLLSEPWMKLRYDEVLRRIEQRMEERNTWQGRLFNPSTPSCVPSDVAGV